MCLRFCKIYMPGLNALETVIIVTLHAIVIIVTICINSL